jgi:phospholipid/cholesterol/gamma-HCH transport system substrate-binding protein
METRANYVLIGLFTVAVIMAGFGFVYWFHRGGGVGEHASYQVVFDGPVSGLRTGAAVLFNGIRVGEVSGLALNADDPRKVIATIEVAKSAPVRSDTRVGVEFQGLTGIATLSLRGGSQEAAPLQPANGQAAILQADLGTSQDLMQSGRDVLRRLDDVLLENQKSFRQTIKNLEVFTEAMVRNTERIDRIVAKTDNVVTGVDHLINGKDGKGGEVREAIEAIRKLAENLDKRTDETAKSFIQLADNLDKRSGETIELVKSLTDNIDKRVDEIGTGLARFSGQGLRQWEALAVDARRAVGEFERAVRNFDRNPGRLIWGGSSEQQQQPAEGAGGRRRR